MQYVTLTCKLVLIKQTFHLRHLFSSPLQFEILKYRKWNYVSLKIQKVICIKGLQTIRVTLDKVRYLEFEEHLQSSI